MFGFALLGGLIMALIIAFGVFVALKAFTIKDKINLKGEDDG